MIMEQDEDLPPRHSRSKRERDEEHDEKKDIEKRAKQVQDLICKRDSVELVELDPIPLIANFFPIKLDDCKLFVHHMQFEPVLEGEATVSRSIKDSMLRANKDAIGQHLYWGELLFVKKDLSQATFSAKVHGVDYKLTLSDQMEIEMGAKMRRNLTQILSILVRSALKRQGYKQLKRAVYKLNQKLQIPQAHMYAVPGYWTNIDAFHGGLFLNVDLRVSMGSNCQEVSQ